MTQSDNHQPNEEQAFKRDDAYKTLNIVNIWINNIDTKVSFALALVGVISGSIFSSGLPNAFQKITEVTKPAELNGGEIISVILVGLLYLNSFISLGSFMLALIARVNNQNKAPSIFFFGSINSMELQKFKNKVKQITECEIIEDLEEQIHTNSRICSQKVKWYNYGVKFLVVTIVLWFICKTFRLL